MSARITAALLMLGVIAGLGLLSTLRADNPAQAGTPATLMVNR